MVFIVTAFYLEGDLKLIIPPVILAFILMLIREIVKDIADIEGDSLMNVMTFPVLYGINKSIHIILGLVFLLILATFYFISLYNITYLISVILFVDIPLIYFTAKLFKNRSASYCKYLEKVLKLITIFLSDSDLSSNYIKIIMSPFIHLHNHSDFSLLESSQSIQSIVDRAKELSMDAIALTEKGNLFSMIDFINMLKKSG